MSCLTARIAFAVLFKVHMSLESPVDPWEMKMSISVTLVQRGGPPWAQFCYGRVIRLRGRKQMKCF